MGLFHYSIEGSNRGQNEFILSAVGASQAEHFQQYEFFLKELFTCFNISPLRALKGSNYTTENFLSVEQICECPSSMILKKPVILFPLNNLKILNRMQLPFG